VQKMDMGMPLSKASKGGFIGNGWGIRRLHPQGNLLWNVMAVPHRLEVLLEAFPKDIPMPVGSNFLGSLGNFRHFSSLETLVTDPFILEVLTCV